MSATDKKLIETALATLMSEHLPEHLCIGCSRFYLHAHLLESGHVERIIQQISVRFSIPVPDQSIWPSFERVRDFASYAAKAMHREKLLARRAEAMTQSRRIAFPY